MLVACGDERDLRKEHTARRNASFERGWQTPKQLSTRMKLDAVGGIRLGDGFVLDPYRACLGLATAAARKGAEFRTHSPVKKVLFTRTHADVIATHGTIRAGKVIVATGSATAEFKGLQRHFTRRETYLAMTAPVPARMRKELGDRAVVLDDAGDMPYRIRWAPGDRLLVCGADQDETSLRSRPAVLLQRTGQLMYELLKRYPVISGLQPAYGWEASYGRTADGLMYIGAHRNYPHHLFALGGLGNITGAFVASRIVLRAIKGVPEKADGAFAWTR